MAHRPAKKAPAKGRVVRQIRHLKKSRERYQPAQVIKALHDTKGMVSLTAEMLRCDPDTVRNYCKRHPTVAAALREERERVTDIAELSLFRAIQNGEAWAVCFYLKTQGRSRGYIERQELETSGPGGSPIEFTLNIGRRPNDWCR